MRNKPTMVELAEFLHCAAGHGHFDNVENVAMWLIGQSDEATEMYHSLRAMARDAGLEDHVSWLHQAACSHDELERLLAAEGWKDAAEILDPSRSGAFRSEYLLSICEARLDRGQGSRRKLEAIRRKLRLSLEKEG